MARNGETATISVGQQVPILTSQQTTGSIVPGATGITQTIQYKDTGIILKVKPVIHAGGRIDVDVSQEVSSAGTTSTGVSSSPTFSSRKIDTKLSIQDGATVLLGGLISDSNERGNSGVPLLKDIPLLGSLFRTQTGSTKKTELIVLITPYIIDDNQAAQAITQAFRAQLGDWAAQSAAVLPTATTSKPVNSGKNETSNPESVKPLAITPEEQKTTEKSPDLATEPLPANEVPAETQTPAPVTPKQGAVVTDPKILEEIRALQKIKK
jgi:general secretion pathway protein D